MREALVAAWDLHDDCKTLRTYRVAPSGATFLDRREVPAAEREATNNQLLENGTRIGYVYYGFVWVLDENGCAVWTKQGLLAAGTREELRVGDEVVRVIDIQSVETFVDPDNVGHRGVRVDMGRRGIVIAEDNFSVEDIPTYSQMDLDWEITWAEFLGRDLALWLRKRYADRHGRVTNAPQLEIYAACCELADILGSDPLRDEASTSLGSLEGSGEVVLRYGTNPLEATGRFIEQKVYTPSGKSWYGRWLKLGTNRQVVAFLRDVRAPATIMQTARELRRKLVEDDYA